MRNSAVDELLPAGLYYWKANFVTELSDEIVEAAWHTAPRCRWSARRCTSTRANGACHRVAPDATAFAYRDANFPTVIAGMWPDPADNDANTEWVRSSYDATAPYSEEGGYVNFMGSDEQERIRANYRGNYERLVAVKRQHDPGNLFHLNQNVEP